MFTPPGSPFPSPRAMEERQRQSIASLTAPSSGSTMPSEIDTSGYSKESVSGASQSSYFPYIPPGSSLNSAPPMTRSLSSSSLASSASSPSFSPLSSPPSSKSRFHDFSGTRSLQTQNDCEFQSRSEAKRRIGRRIKWIAIAIPIVLVLVTLGNHCTAELLGMNRWITNGQKQLVEQEMAHDWPGVEVLDVVSDGLHSSHPHHHHVHQSLKSPSISTSAHEDSVLKRQTSSEIVITVSATGSSLDMPTTLASSTTASSSATSTIPATAQNLPTTPTTTPVLPTPFPQPWDSDISQNFSTSGCFNFFQNMTNSDAFRSCRPFGLLQSTSDTFSDLQSNLTALNDVVWGTCNPTLGVDQCTTNMATFASSLQSACATDLSAGNLNAVKTLQALQAYSLTYNTGCLTDPSTSSYCYVKAAHNTNPSDLYFYSLPDGVAISNTITMTCSACTKSLMSLYVNALNANASEFLELASVYANAQSLASSACGSSYALKSTSSLADSGNSASALDCVWFLRTSFLVAGAVLLLVM